MDKLTEKQYNILMYIVDHVIKKMYQPSFREIADHFAVSQSAIHQTLHWCEKKGWIQLISAQGRSIVINYLLVQLYKGAEKKEKWVK
jgi:SOS-response transcriptional repressor LexA